MKPERLYKLRDLPGTALIMPVVYSFRDQEHSLEILVGKIIELPANTKSMIESTIAFGRSNGYQLTNAMSLAESVVNRYHALGGTNGGAQIVEVAPAGLKVSVVMNPPGAPGQPKITGEILAMLDADGEVYSGSDPDTDGAKPGWLPFAFE